MISVAHRFADRDARIVAIGADGREHIATSAQWGGGGKLYQITSTFDKLPLKDVKTFRFQTRPYEWVEFRNVSLHAGEKTNVEVIRQWSGEYPRTGSRPRRRERNVAVTTKWLGRWPGKHDDIALACTMAAHFAEQTGQI